MIFHQYPEYTDPHQTTNEMTCSICHQTGHNKRTCSNQQKATTGKYAGMTATQIEAIFAERERKNYEELVAPIIAPKLACADCGQVETECRLERMIGGKIMCCDCLDPKPTEEEEEDDEESVCDDEQRSYGARGAPAPESDDEEEKCGCCEAPLDEDEHIFIFTKGDEEVTMCRVCGDDTHEQMKADGWTRDDDSAGGANDSDFTDCDACGYTHLCEDKCPNEATACHYEKWRADHECPDCGNTFSDAQITSKEVVPCVRCAKCFVGDCGKTTCDCVFSDAEKEDEDEGESDDSWEPECCKCGTTTDSKGMGEVEHREDLCEWMCGRCYEYHTRP